MRAASSLLAIGLDRAAPLAPQIFVQMRELILSGRLDPGARLPSSRALAAELGVSRNTVAAAFDQLLAEGAVEGRAGSGTFVAAGLRPLREAKGDKSPDIVLPKGRERRAFEPGLPDHNAFPYAAWSRALARAWRRGGRDLLNSEPAGLMTLRAAIAGHVRVMRGVRCEADDIVLAPGSSAALALAVRVIASRGDGAVVEEPGYPGHRAALLSAGLRLLPIPVDGEGLDAGALPHGSPARSARLACVTPSHHYPLGPTLTLSRRLALLEWAGRDRWIVEDDYDSEFRYRGPPLPALQGLDTRGRVLYLGSFSKSLFPGLRLAYLVAPRALVPALRSALEGESERPSTVAQAALASFIAEGHYAAHLARMRRLYARRQETLLAAADRHFPGLLETKPDSAGMHLVAWLAPALARRMDDREAARRAAEAGVTVRPLSAFYTGRAGRQGLLLGYAGVPEDEIARAAARLAGALSGSAGCRPDPSPRRDRRASRCRPARRVRSRRSSAGSGA